jgi:uroporphyrinogen decarboxylase
MTRRECFKQAMSHQTANQVPLDFAGTGLTAVADPQYYERLADALSLPKSSPDQTKEAVLCALDTDFRCVGDVLRPQNSLCKKGPNWYTDCWGVTRTWTGLYYDITDSPLKDATLEDLKRFPFPKASEIPSEVFDTLALKAKKLWFDSDYIVVGGHPVYGVMELGCWMCGYDDFLYRMAAEPEFVELFYKRVYEYQEEVIEAYYSKLGDYIHVTTSGDDFGTQSGPMISPTCFREQIAPFMKRRIELTKSMTKAYFFHHTCGSVYRLLPELLATGIDILNPVQPGAFEMEPDRLKPEFGDRLVFWGAIDEQNLLSHGTVSEVEQEVRRVLDIMSEQGGFVAAPSHNVQMDVPPENLIAMCRAVKEYSR